MFTKIKDYGTNKTVSKKKIVFLRIKNKLIE